MRCSRPLLALVALACNDGLQPTPVPTSCPAGFRGVCGTITFRGALPDSTDKLYVVAYQAFPQSINDLFTFQPVPPPELPQPSPGDSTTTYTLPLPNGQYHWVLAVWKKVGTLSVANADSLLREAGYYRDPSDSTQAGLVIVNATGTDHINFVMDFTNMHPVSYYFPVAP
jgi:hypothetical protein